MVQYHPSVKWNIHLKPLTLTLVKNFFIQNVFPLCLRKGVFGYLVSHNKCHTLCQGNHSSLAKTNDRGLQQIQGKMPNTAQIREAVSQQHADIHK